MMEKGHIQKYVVSQVKVLDQMEQLTKKMKNHTHRFLNNKHETSMLMDQH